MSSTASFLKKIADILKKIAKKTKVSPIDELDYVPFAADIALLAGGTVDMENITTDEMTDVRCVVKDITTTAPLDTDVAKEWIACKKHAISEHKEAQLRHVAGEVIVAIMSVIATNTALVVMLYLIMNFLNGIIPAGGVIP